MTKDSKFWKNVCLSVTSDSFAIPWTVALQAPLSMGLSKQEYWSGLPFPSPGIFPTQGSHASYTGRWVLAHWATCQFSSAAQSCLTLWDPMDCSMPREVHKFWEHCIKSWCLYRRWWRHKNISCFDLCQR